MAQDKYDVNVRIILFCAILVSSFVEPVASKPTPLLHEVIGIFAYLKLTIGCRVKQYGESSICVIQNYCAVIDTIYTHFGGYILYRRPIDPTHMTIQ